MSQRHLPTTGPQSTTVGDICDRFQGEVQTGPFGSQLHSSDYTPDGTPVVMPQDMHDGRVSTSRIARVDQSHAKRLRQHALRRGDIAFSRRGDVARFAVITEAEEGWLCGTGSIRIRLNCPDIEVGYLRRYLSLPSTGAWLEHNAKGVTMPNLNTAIVRALPLAYPPLPEQRRIAAILDQADALRAKRREALAQLDSLTQSIFIEMFGEPGRHSKGWPAESLEGAALEINDCPHSTPVWTDEGFVCLRTSNLGVGGWDWTDTRYVSESTFHDRSKRGHIEPGDIVLSREGTVGIAAIVQTGMRLCMGQRLVQVRPDSSSVLPDYLLRHLLHVLSPLRIGQFMVGSTSQHLNVKELRAMPIPIPPLALQQTFATRIQAVESLKATHGAALAELDALFASLQHRAFAGGL